MEDFVRLSEGDDDAAKRVIAAMREEQPPAGAMQRALVAVGIGGAGMATAGGALANLSTAPKLSQSLISITLKWLSAGAAVGLAAGTGATALKPPAPAPVSALSASTTRTAQATRPPIPASEQRIEP